MNRDNKKDIEYSVLNCFKEICRLQELEEKGQITPEDKIWLDKIWKALNNAFDLFRRENTKTEYKSSGSHYDENGKRILEKGETVNSCNIFSKSTGKDTWSLLIYTLSQHSEFMDVLRNRTRIEMRQWGNQWVSTKKENRLPQEKIHIKWYNVLTSEQLGGIEEQIFCDAIAEIPYNDDATLNETMARFDKLPQKAWNMLRPYIIKYFLMTQSLPDDEITDDETDVSDIITRKKIKEKIIEDTIEDTEENTIKDKIEFEKKHDAIIKISKEILNHEQWEIFDLHDIKQMKLIDIASSKGIKYSRVKQIYRTVKNKIKKDKRIKYPLK